MSRRQKGTDRTNWVTAIDPESGKPATMTQKAFDGVYRDKGFEIVDRENVDRVAPARNVRKNRPDDDGSQDGGQTGSAADVASRLNIATGEGANEKHADNKGAASEARQSAGRDRGRG